MDILGIHHVSLIVADTQRSLDFYQGVLGMPVAENRPDLSFPGAWLQLSQEHQIHLLEVDNPYDDIELPVHGGRDRHVAFSVAGLDELAQRMKDADIEFRMSRSGRKALFCRDPDGNTLEFIESRPVPQ